MRNADKKLVESFKRFIHVLSTGKNRSFEYEGETFFRAEVHVLEMVGRRPGISAVELAESLGVTKGAVSQLVVKLLRKDLLRREPAPDNRRVQHLFATRRGEAVLLFHEERERQILAAVMEQLRHCDEEQVRRFALVVDMVGDFAGD